MPEEVNESDQDEVKSHVNKSKLEIAQDREVYEKKNAKDLCLTGSYREHNPIADDSDTPINHHQQFKQQEYHKRRTMMLQSEVIKRR